MLASHSHIDFEVVAVHKPWLQMAPRFVEANGNHPKSQYPDKCLVPECHVLSFSVMETPQSSAKQLILLARLRLWPFHLIGTHWHFSSTEEDREVVPVAGVRRFSQSATQKDLFFRG